MASEDQDRDAALRAELVKLVRSQDSLQALGHRARPGRLPVALVTGVVLVLVVAVSVVALQLTSGRSAPAIGGASPTRSAAPASEEAAVPEETLPPGKLLARFSSEDGPDQDHTVHVGGYAIATQFICSGDGSYSVFTAEATGESGDGGCSGGGVGAGGVNVKGSTTVRIRTDPDMEWTYTLVGIAPPKRVQLRSIPDPTDSTGTVVPYFTSDDLAARFSPGLRFGTERDATAGELVFINRTSRTCALAGYPQVRFLSGGKPLGHNTMNQIDPRRSTEDGLQAVILEPGGPAYSQINWYAAGENSEFEGACEERAVDTVQVDLSYDLADPRQTGAFTVPIGDTVACLNGEHGALGRYGQISSTVFVDYAAGDDD